LKKNSFGRYPTGRESKVALGDSEKMEQKSEKNQKKKKNALINHTGKEKRIEN